MSASRNNISGINQKQDKREWSQSGIRSWSPTTSKQYDHTLKNSAVGRATAVPVSQPDHLLTVHDMI